MQRADIYLLQSTAFSDQLEFCCKLTEKAFQQGHNIHIQTREGYQNEALNERLWNFRRDSFLPHAVGQGQATHYPITIDISSLSPDGAGHRDLLITLSADVPDNIREFERVGIIVLNDPEELKLARHSYKLLAAENLDVRIHDFRSKNSSD